MHAAKALFQLIRETMVEWTEHRGPRLGAALAYYTVFSLAPLVIIATLIAGSLFGSQELAQARLVAQISQFIGADAAEFVNELATSARLPREAGNTAIGLGVATLLLGALGVFGQLQDAFDTIWEVTPNPRANLWRLLRNRLLSFAMLLVLGFLLLVSLITSALLSAAGEYLEARFAHYGLFAALVNGLLPIVFAAVLFTFMFRVLPNVHLTWRDVWPSALLTTLLFSLGRFAINFYLSTTHLGTAYGAAGSVVVILVWVYFSAQILFFGAAFNRVYVRHYGSGRPEPSEDAVPLSETDRLKQGMPRKAEVEAAADAQAANQPTPPRRRWLPWVRLSSSDGVPGRTQLGVLFGFLAGVGTGAVISALTFRGGSGRSV